MAFASFIQEAYGQIAAALITVLVGFIIAKVSGRLAKRIFAEAELNRILIRAGFKPISDAFGTAIEYLIYAATFLLILQQFGLTEIVLVIIAIIAIAVIGFSLTLTIRDFIPNAIIGMLIRKRMKAKLGKNVQIGLIKGKLKRIGIVSSTVVDKDEYYVPHLYSSKFI